MSEKTAIIFDCFGVICSKPIETWMRDNLGDTPEVMAYFDDVAHRFDLNILTEEDLMNELGIRVSREPRVIRDELDQYLSFDNDLVDYIRELKEAGKKIALLSNGNHVTFERKILSKNPWFRPLFDSMVVSSEVGMRKPDPNIYLHTLQTISALAEEAVFIDDNRMNIEGARELGIHSILFTDVASLRKELEGIIS